MPSNIQNNSSEIKLFSNSASCQDQGLLNLPQFMIADTAQFSNFANNPQSIESMADNSKKQYTSGSTVFNTIQSLQTCSLDYNLGRSNLNSDPRVVIPLSDNFGNQTQLLRCNAVQTQLNQINVDYDMKDPTVAFKPHQAEMARPKAVEQKQIHDFGQYTSKNDFNFSFLDLQKMSQSEIEYVKYMWLSTSPFHNYYRGMQNHQEHSHTSHQQQFDVNTVSQDKDFLQTNYNQFQMDTEIGQLQKSIGNMLNSTASTVQDLSFQQMSAFSHNIAQKIASQPTETQEEKKSNFDYPNPPVNANLASDSIIHSKRNLADIKWFQDTYVSKKQQAANQQFFQGYLL